MKIKAILLETILATLIGSLLGIGALFVEMPAFVAVLPMFVVTLFSVRRGVVVGFRIAVLISVVIAGISIKYSEIRIIDLILYHYSACIIGLFVKNIHRNLNNKKMNTVQLNVITAQVLSTGVMVCLTLFNSKSGITILDCVCYGIISIILLLILAYAQPKVILTSRSVFLTSKERSKLLND